MNSTLTKPFPGRILGAPFQGRSFFTAPDHVLVRPEDVWMFDPISGAMPAGYNVEADVITQTTDGRLINDLWAEFQQVVAIHNERRQKMIDLLTFPVNQVIEDVPTLLGDDFEEASEFGVPHGTRTQMTYWSMAYDFKWYDIATRYTWKFLAEASSQQVESVHQGVLEADNRLVFKKVMNTLFNNVNRTASIKGNNYTVYTLYNGTDGAIPPDYKTNTFLNTHTHYQFSGAATLDSGDVEAMITDMRSHGYGESQGTELVLLVNSAEGDVIRSWRYNQVNNNAAVAKYDFIPATNQPALIIPNAQGLLGTQVGGTFAGLVVIGSYGPVRVVQEEYIPAGYMVLLGTGGDANLANPVGIREHANPSLRGLRLLPGNQTNYPLIDAYYSRGFGSGIRQRGAAIIMKLSAAGPYTIPTQYA